MEEGASGLLAAPVSNRASAPRRRGRMTGAGGLPALPGGDTTALEWELVGEELGVLDCTCFHLTELGHCGEWSGLESQWHRLLMF